MILSTHRRLVAIVLLFASLSVASAQVPSVVSPRDTFSLMAEEEQKRLIDPAINRVPYERLDEARHQLLQQKSAQAGARSAISNITWQERGPNNIGGRTRAVLFDPNDPTHKKVWVGSVAGGLWYTNDITDANTSWTPVSDTWENVVITAIAADPSNPQIMYVGTGDVYNSVAGGGIWKTTNGGTTWTRLTSSIPNSTIYGSLSSALRYIQRIVVNSSGAVFVGTQYGVVKSTDGGASWSYSLAPAQNIGATGTSTDSYYDKVTDLEIGSDGVLYAAFYPTKIYKLTTGSTWTDITPASTSVGERTELALAPGTSGTSQVVYAVTRKYNSSNYGQDILWFKKSTNAGSSWTDIAIPVYNGGYHFTYGNGSYALNLVVHPTDANTVYAGGYDWFRSTDGGATWVTQLTNTYQYQQGLGFQPGSGTSVVLITDGNGVSWSTDWGNSSVTTPTLNSRNNGYRTAEVSTVSMKGSPGSAYLLAGVRSKGYMQLSMAGLSTGSTVFGISNTGISFIDDNEPSIQIMQSYGTMYLYSSTGSTPITSVNAYYFVMAADYDSQTNTLYVADIVNGQGIIRKITGVGSTPQSTTFALSGGTNLATYIKLSSDRTKLYVGTGSAQVYQVTNLNQANPTVTQIDNGALPQYSSVSCIDAGASDELLVTFTNYGIQSVWYTNSGGVLWTGKDQTNFGLPDVPVRSALFNPQNRKQVLLGTDAGIWSTDDITAANPGWGFSGAGMGTFQVNQLRYRAADGRITAVTNGRGIWATDAFAIPYTLPSISLTSVSNATLCAGNTVAVSFTSSGPAFNANNQFEVWLSDANGSFTNAIKIGSGATSPISVTLPSGSSAAPYGTNYRIKIVSTNPEVESNISSALAIGDLNYASVYDRLVDVKRYSTYGYICSGSRVTLKAYPYSYNGAAVTADSYQWTVGGSTINGATSLTVSAQQAGTYGATIKQAGCSVTSAIYRLDIASSSSIYNNIISQSNGGPQCYDHPLTLSSDYAGETAGFQWTRDGVDIAGATSSTFVASQTGKYSYRFTDGSCNGTTTSTIFQFSQSLFASIDLSLSGDSLICTSYPYYGVGIVTNIPSGNDYSVQWYRNGVAIPGATYSSYYGTVQPGAYSILLKQGACQTFSNAVNIRLADQLQVGITYYFNNKAACVGEGRYLSANISSNGSFQWQKNGVDIAGATNSYYYATTSGDYTVKLTRGTCSAVSLPVSLTFSNAIQPKIFYYNSSLDACSGRSLYAYDYYNMSGYQWQWYRNGVLLSGAINSSYYADQPGAYSVSLTNGSCTGLSKEVYVNVGNGQTAKPTIVYSPSTRQLCANNSLQLTASFSNNSVQWYRNGVAITGATNSQYYATQSGIYTAVVIDGSCSAESDPVEVKIGEATTASISGTALVGSGQSVQLPVSFTGPAPWSFTLSNGQSVTATYQNPTLVSVSPTSNTTYQVASVANACGLGTVSGQASVSVGSGSADVSLNMVVNNRTPAVGGVVTYRLTAANAGPNAANGIQLSSVLPSGLSFVGSSSPGVSASNGVVSVSLGSIPANSSSSISFQATPTQPGVFATSAQVTASQTPDPDSQPNSGTGDGQDDAVTVDVRTPVSGGYVVSANTNQVPLPQVQSNQPASDANSADLRLSMWVDKASVQASDVVSTSLLVSNRGGATASSIVVQVVLPNGTFSTQSPVGWLAVSGQTYKAYVNSLAAGKSAVLWLKWQPVGSGSIQAQILDVDVPDPDSVPGNGYTNGEDDTATVSVRVR